MLIICLLIPLVSLSYAYIQTAVVAVVCSTTFLQYPKQTMIDANYYMSVCFFSLMFM